MPPSGNIQGTFDQKTGASGSVSYAHPHEKEILKKARMVLKQTKTGQELLDIANKWGVTIKVFKNRNAHGLAQDRQTAYVGLSPSQEEPDALMILELAAALREVQHILMGYTVPDESTDPLGAATAKHAKFLDIVIQMCKIGHELTESMGTSEYVDILEDLGHGEIYKAHVAEASKQQIVDKYVEAHEKVQQT